MPLRRVKSCGRNSCVQRRVGILFLALPAIACNGPALNEPLDTRTPVVIAHRGASAVAPEHTISAFDKAVEERTDYIELDVQRTKDGALVVIHDATLDRTMRGGSFDCTGRVADRTIAQIERCDAGSWFNSAYPNQARPEFAGLRVPRLADVLARYGATTKLYIEIKDPESYPGIEADLIALFQRHGIVSGAPSSPRVFIQSFSMASLLRVRSLDPTLPLIQLYAAASSPAIIAQLSEVRSYAAGIGVRKDDITAALIQSAHAGCLLVHAYSSDDELEMLSLLAMGVDGIFTGRPDQLRDAIDRARDRDAENSGCSVVAR